MHHSHHKIPLLLDVSNNVQATYTPEPVSRAPISSFGDARRNNAVGNPAICHFGFHEYAFKTLHAICVCILQQDEVLHHLKCFSRLKYGFHLQLTKNLLFPQDGNAQPSEEGQGGMPAPSNRFARPPMPMAPRGPSYQSYGSRPFQGALSNHTRKVHACEQQ